MRNLAFELGFDWQVKPVVGIRDGVYPLQMCLVDDDERQVISPCNAEQVTVGSALRFRVYDFTYQAREPGPRPTVLQALFTAGTTDPGDPFSPIEIDGQSRAQWAATVFRRSEIPSLAFGVASGWEALWAGEVIGGEIAELPLSRSGRFEFRGLLTVEALGEMARFYRIDPEMVVGGGGPGSLESVRTEQSAVARGGA